jgi:CysZ protein
MITALQKAFAQLFTDPRMWKLLVLSILLSICGFTALWAALGGSLHWIFTHWARFAGWLDWAGGIGSFVVTCFLFPTMFVLVQSFFQDAVANAVEARHYPGLPPATGAPFLVSIFRGVKFFLFMLALNLGAAPVFLGMMFLVGSGAAVYAVINGFLAGREYFEVVALRRMAARDVDFARKDRAGAVFWTGLAVTLMGTVPGLNLLMPIIGAAAMVHVAQSPAPVRKGGIG